MGVITKIKHILWDYDTLYGEILCGLLTLGWGITILSSGDFSSILAFLNTLLPHYVWGAAIGTLGAIQLISAINGMSTWRRAAGVIVLPLWTFLGLVILIGGITEPGIFFYGLFALLCAWINLRLTICRF